MTTKRIKVLKFSAEWCQTCKLLEPSVKQLATEYKQSNKPIVFMTIDADNEDTKCEFDNFKIATMPTMVLLVEEINDNNEIVNSREISRINGLKPKQAIRTLLDWQLDSLSKSQL